MRNELKVAKSAAIESGKILLKYYKNRYKIADKGENNPVTTADLESNNYLKNYLLKMFPDYGWLSEETEDSSSRLLREYVWIVDPLDGTKEFIQGIPEFVVSIALVRDGEPVLGVLYNPVKEELFHSEKGEPAYLNGVIIRCSSKDELSDSKIIISNTEMNDGLWKDYEMHFSNMVACGSVAYKIAKTAAGSADIFATLMSKNEWDICAADAIIQGADGIIKATSGHPLCYNSGNTKISPVIIGGNQIVVDKAISLFNRIQKQHYSAL